MDDAATVLVPASVSFSDLTPKVLHASSAADLLGRPAYNYADRIVGKADIRMNDVSAGNYKFKETVGAEAEEEEVPSEKEPVETSEPSKKDSHSIHIEISPKTIGIALGLIASLVVLILVL